MPSTPARNGTNTSANSANDRYPLIIRMERRSAAAIAKGDADVYPRFSPTMEWDTAAGDAILTGAGGRVTEGDSNKPLFYGKPNYRNLDFIAWSKLNFF